MYRNCTPDILSYDNHMSHPGNRATPYIVVMHAHVVSVTKVRHTVFADQHLTRREQIMREVCAGFEAELLEFNAADNHVTCSSTSHPRWPWPAWSTA
ncbi:hypothetical protein GCM10010443_24850 [Actinoplanes cyaneus]